eukprot:COSAG05_NODE_2050_length_3639_cov_2.035876_2_plen_61_part_00
MPLRLCESTKESLSSVASSGAIRPDVSSIAAPWPTARMLPAGRDVAFTMTGMCVMLMLPR